MNESMVEKCTCVFNIRHHVWIKIYVPHLGISWVK
jgi:hypothetical protein